MKTKEIRRIPIERLSARKISNTTATAKPKKRIYLAGPDVFFPNPGAHFDRLKQLCEENGFVGVVPSDGGLSKGFTGTGDEIAERIYRANLDMIGDCDAVLANLNPFRGQMEPDSGTVFEIGFAIALNKPVYGYLSDSDVSYEQKVERLFGRKEAEGIPYDKEFGYMIECFGQPANLMLSRSTRLFEDAAKALEAFASFLKRTEN